MSNMEVDNLQLLTAPAGADVYVVKTNTDYRVRIAEPNGLATLGASGLVPDSQLPAPTASSPSGIVWSTVSVNTTMATSRGYIAVGALTMTLPLAVPAGNRFVVHNDSTNPTGTVVTVAVNGNTINKVVSAEGLTLSLGQTAHLVAVANGILEIV